jgi:hypothetical protein
MEQNTFSQVGAGLDGRDSKIYQEYDSKGRMNDSFYQKAAMAGIKNLETKSFRNDSSCVKSQDRFPEKYMHTAGPAQNGYSSRRASNGGRVAWQPNNEDHMSFATNLQTKLDENHFDVKNDLPIQRLPKMSKSEQ